MLDNQKQKAALALTGMPGAAATSREAVVMVAVVEIQGFHWERSPHRWCPPGCHQQQRQ